MNIEEKLERGLFVLWVGATYRTEEENVEYVYRGFIDQPCGSRRHVFAPVLGTNPRVDKWIDYAAVKYSTLCKKFQKFPNIQELEEAGSVWND